MSMYTCIPTYVRYLWSPLDQIYKIFKTIPRGECNRFLNSEKASESERRGAENGLMDFLFFLLLGHNFTKTKK